jgi:hypothetical protein
MRETGIPITLKCRASMWNARHLSAPSFSLSTQAFKLRRSPKLVIKYRYHNVQFNSTHHTILYTMTLSKATFSIMKLSATAQSIMTPSIVTFSKKILSNKRTQDNDNQHIKTQHNTQYIDIWHRTHYTTLYIDTQPTNTTACNVMAYSIVKKGCAQYNINLIPSVTI